jgi:hypothetical protein
MVLVRIFTIFLLFLFGSSILVFGQTPQRIYVNVSAVDTINANGSLNLPYHRIQLAINNAVKGDSIFVSKGRYLENINFLGKEIFVSSNYFFSKDTTDISQTIIDGNNKDIAVKFQSNETRKSVLYGFNVTNGWAGISIANCSPTLDYLILEGNRSVYDRGSAIIASDNCSFLLDHSTIRNHTGGNGIISIGNIHSDSAYTIRNSIFHNNICQNTVVISDGRGGGIFENNLFYNHTVPAIGFINTQNGIKIINTTIVSNGAESVRHLYNNIYQSNVIIVNSILNSENTSLQIGMNNPIPSTFFVIKNSFVKGGAQAISRLQTTTLEDSSTIFSDVSQIQNFVQNNFRLQNSSSLIGSGISSFIFNSQEIKSPISDILGNSRPNPTGSSPDLGAYESPFKHPSPLVISAEGGDKSVRLRWTQAPGSRLARYKVFRSTSPIPDNTTAGVVTDTISVGRLEYMDATGLTNLTRYHYRMKTIDSAGIESGMSNEISVTPNVLPATPSGISVEKGPGRIGIKWQISSDLSTTYEVLRRSKDSSIQILFSNKRVSSFIDSNINVGEYYEYAVRSIDQFGVKSIINFSNYINSNQLIFVSKTGNDEALGSLESPLLTISKALSISKNNDTVIVNTGIYLERIIINKKIVLGSQYILTSDSSFRSKTIIDGQSGGTVIRTDVAGVKIMGITIQNGYSSQGGGVFGSNLELDYIIIRKCRGVGDIDGGGAYIGGRTKITNSLFEENIGRKGGALTLFPSNDTIFVNNSVFKYNNGWENGSGIICFGNLS